MGAVFFSLHFPTLDGFLLMNFPEPGLLRLGRLLEERVCRLVPTLRGIFVAFGVGVVGPVRGASPADLRVQKGVYGGGGTSLSRSLGPNPAGGSSPLWL